MIVKGNIKNEETGAPVIDAQISIKINDITFFEGKSIKEGLFEKSDDGNFIGATLTCRVEMEGFKIWETQFEIEAEEHDIQVALKPQEIKLKIKIADQKGQSIAGAKISFSSNAEGYAWEGVSGSNGEYIAPPNKLEFGDIVNFTVNLIGFKQSTGSISIEQENSLTIKMTQIEEKPERNWKWIIFKLVLALIFFIISFFFFDDHNQLVGFLFILFGLATIILGFFRKKLFSKKNKAKPMITGTVIAKNQSSQKEGSGFIVIKEPSGNRLNLNISLDSFQELKIGDTIRFKKRKKLNKTIKDLEVVPSSGKGDV